MEELNFEEMRNQIGILKTKLDNQDIVNDRLIRSIIDSKTNDMKRPMIFSIFCALFVIAAAPMSFREVMGCSWYFIIATDIMMLYCIVREYIFKHQIKSDIMSDSLLDVAKKMETFKKDYKRYTIFNMCLLLPLWLVWLVIETFMSKDDGSAIALTIGMAVGLIIGTVIGLRMYFNIQNSATDIIKQIEE